MEEDARPPRPCLPREHRRAGRVGRADGRAARIFPETPAGDTRSVSPLLGLRRRAHRRRPLGVGFND